MFVCLFPGTMALFQAETVVAERAALLCTEGPRQMVSNPALCTSLTHHRTARCVCARTCLCTACFISVLAFVSFLWLPVAFHKQARGRMTKHGEWRMCAVHLCVCLTTYRSMIFWLVAHDDVGKWKNLSPPLSCSHAVLHYETFYFIIVNVDTFCCILSNIIFQANWSVVKKMKDFSRRWVLQLMLLVTGVVAGCAQQGAA